MTNRTVSIRNAYALLLIAAMTVMGGCSTSRHTAQRKEGPRNETHQPPKGPSTHRSAEALIAEARTWLGTKYSYGGHSRKGTDCSGLVMELFLKVFDIKLPRNSAKQQQYCVEVKRHDMLPGDLVFFATGRNRSKVSHVGLYIGDGDMIHASASKGVIISKLKERYYTDRYHSTGRVPATNPSSPQPSEAEIDRPLFRLEVAPTDIVTPTLDDAIDAKIDSIYSSMLD